MRATTASPRCRRPSCATTRRPTRRARAGTCGTSRRRAAVNSRLRPTARASSMSSVRLARTAGWPCPPTRVVRRPRRRRAPDRTRRRAGSRSPSDGEAAAAHQGDDVGQQRQPLARALGVVPRLHGHDGARRAGDGGAGRRAGAGPGRTSASTKTSVGAVVAAAPAAQACGLPTHPAGSGGARMRSHAARQGHRRRRDRAEWSSTTTSSSPGRSWATSGASRCGRARCLVAGRDDDGDGRPAAPQAVERAVRPQQQPAEAHPAAYSPQPTSRDAASPSTIAAARRPYDRVMADRPRRQEQERAADRGHRGRARRAAGPAADRHARPRPRQLLRARGRAGRGHRRSRPARAAPVTPSSSSASPAPASRSSGCTRCRHPQPPRPLRRRRRGCAPRPAPTSSPTSGSA